MDSENDVNKMCRLCLAKDQVDVHIFKEKQIFLKISTCLPVKISCDDTFPKKICLDCSGQLDAMYQFWNKSINSESQLLTWLENLSTDNGLSSINLHSEVHVKEETIDFLKTESDIKTEVMEESYNNESYNQRLNEFPDQESSHTKRKRDDSLRCRLNSNDDSLVQEKESKIMGTVNKTYKRFRYTVDALQSAVKAVREGRASANKASKEFNIPRSTLINKLHGKSEVDVRKMGPAAILSTEEEMKIEQWIIQKANIGFLMHPEDIKDAVQKLVQETHKKNPFRDDRPGKKWLSLFLARHPCISKKNAAIIAKSRASVTEQDLRSWFVNLETYLKEENALDILTDADRIYNADETGVQLCPKTGQLLGPKKFRNFYDGGIGQEKESITVLTNFSASGRIPPPCIVYPYKLIPPNVVKSIPDYFSVGRSDTGWMVGKTLFEYVSNCFYNWLLENNVKLPILFLLDGHKSRITPELAEFCKEKRILLFCLLPNATHIIQPSEVGIFQPLKSAWRKELYTFMQKTNKTLTKVTFASVFGDAFLKACKTEIIQNAFRACGLYPFDVNAVNFGKCMHTRQKPDILVLISKTSSGNVFLETFQREIS